MATRKPKPSLGGTVKSQLNKELNTVLSAKLRQLLKTPMGKVIAAVILAVVAAAGYLTEEDSSSSTQTTAQTPRPKGEFVLQGKVTHVADGDTINVQVNGQRERVRLANIDAPESDGRSDRPGQAYADQSQQAMAAMVLNKTLTLNCFEQDHYGRNVCNVMLPDGRIANQVLVEQGLAWAYTGSNGRYLRDKSLIQVQEQAQKAKRGLWKDNNPTPPWVWRVQCWQQKQCN